MLDQEIACYQRKLPGLRSASSGKYVLIRGDEVLGLFPTEREALRAGFRRCGLSPFFVSRVRRKAERISVPGTVLRG
jgi:hypothetical protein